MPSLSESQHSGRAADRRSCAGSDFRVMEDRSKKSESANRRKQIYVHKLQGTYARGFGLVLFGYTLLVFGLGFIVPFFVPAIKLISPLPLEVRGSAASRFFFLIDNIWPALLDVGQSIWPVLVVVILAAAALSFYVTHRFVGPLCRLQESLGEFAQGNLSLRIQLREGDHLQDFAELANSAFANVEHAMIEIRDRGGSGSEAGRAVLDEMRAQPAADKERLDKLELAVKESQQQIEEVLKRFRFSGSS